MANWITAEIKPIGTKKYIQELFDYVKENDMRYYRVSSETNEEITIRANNGYEFQVFVNMLEKKFFTKEFHIDMYVEMDDDSYSFHFKNGKETFTKYYLGMDEGREPYSETTKVTLETIDETIAKIKQEAKEEFGDIIN